MVDAIPFQKIWAAIWGVATVLLPLVQLLWTYFLAGTSLYLSQIELLNVYAWDFQVFVNDKYSRLTIMSFWVFGSNRKEWDFQRGNLIDVLKSHVQNFLGSFLFTLYGLLLVVRINWVAWLQMSPL